MEKRELNLNSECKDMNLNGECKGGDGFIDRSKVRILLCDNDSKSLKEVFELLLECSYQVTSVKSARQVIDALNAEGPDIDIILAEVDLPMNKGMKMLKYITRDKNLRRIPVIMMSRQDEVSVVVKCLKLGAADYLVKPLRTNELLNLWTHMWRRRRMLGLAEKNLLNYDFDLMASDPSDANTTSTTLFSDDTDDKTRRCTNSETGATNLKENESPAAAAVGTADGTATSATLLAMDPPNHVADCQTDMPGARGHHAGQLSSVPKKSQLKIGESSAFFTYVKSTVQKTNCQGNPLVMENGSHHSALEENLQAAGQGKKSAQRHEHGDAQANHLEVDDFHGGTSISDSLERSCTPPTSVEFRSRNYKQENMSQVVMKPRNGSSQINVSNLSAQTAYPYYMHGVMNQVLMQQQSSHVYPKNLHDMQGHQVTSAIIPHYSHHQLSHHPNGMSGFQYYHPIGLCLQPGQMSTSHACSSVGNSSSNEVKLNKVDRREAALIKFRQKRKERCFDKKIRYVNRKKLAERRPRVRGQFVRKVNGVNVDLNGQPESADCDEDEEEEDEENASRDSSPEDDAL